MSKEFQEYLRLWKATNQFIESPSKEGEEIVQDIVDKMLKKEEAEDVKEPPKENDVQLESIVTSAPSKDEPFEGEKLSVEDLLSGCSDIPSFGEILRDLLRERYITQKELSDLIMYGTTTISAWMSGKQIPTSLDEVRRICEELDVTQTQQALLFKAYACGLLISKGFR